MPLIITNAGKSLLITPENTGTNAVTLTRLALGTGSAAEPATAAALVSESSSQPITGQIDETAGVIAGAASFENDSGAEVNVTEMGIFARVGDGDEVLFAYDTDAAGLFTHYLEVTQPIAFSIHFSNPDDIAAEVTIEVATNFTLNNDISAPFASAAEAQAGVANNVVLSPATGKALVDAFKSSTIISLSDVNIPTLVGQNGQFLGVNDNAKIVLKDPPTGGSSSATPEIDVVFHSGDLVNKEDIIFAAGLPFQNVIQNAVPLTPHPLVSNPADGIQGTTSVVGGLTIDPTTGRIVWNPENVTQRLTVKVNKFKDGDSIISLFSAGNTVNQRLNPRLISFNESSSGGSSISDVALLGHSGVVGNEDLGFKFRTHFEDLVFNGDVPSVFESQYYYIFKVKRIGVLLNFELLVYTPEGRLVYSNPALESSMTASYNSAYITASLSEADFEPFDLHFGGAFFGGSEVPDRAWDGWMSNIILLRHDAHSEIPFDQLPLINRHRLWSARYRAIELTPERTITHNIEINGSPDLPDLPATDADSSDPAVDINFSASEKLVYSVATRVDIKKLDFFQAGGHSVVTPEGIILGQSNASNDVLMHVEAFMKLIDIESDTQIGDGFVIHDGYALFGYRKFNAYHLSSILGSREFTQSNIINPMKHYITLEYHLSLLNPETRNQIAGLFSKLWFEGVQFSFNNTIYLPNKWE